jgi:hypothetical protein
MPIASAKSFVVAPSYPFDQNSNMAASRACTSLKPLGRPIFVRIVSVLIALKRNFWNALFKNTASAHNCSTSESMATEV